jgi:hypothetical protein
VLNIAEKMWCACVCVHMRVPSKNILVQVNKILSTISTYYRVNISVNTVTEMFSVKEINGRMRYVKF